MTNSTGKPFSVEYTGSWAFTGLNDSVAPLMASTFWANSGEVYAHLVSHKNTSALQLFIKELTYIDEFISLVMTNLTAHALQTIVANESVSLVLDTVPAQYTLVSNFDIVS